MAQFEKTINLGDFEGAISGSFKTKIYTQRGDIAFVVYDPKNKEFDAFGVHTGDIEYYAKEYAENYKYNPDVKIFIFGKDGLEYLAKVLDAFEKIGFDKERLWVKSRANILIDPQTGEFTFSSIFVKENYAEIPTLLKASFNFPQIETIDDFHSFLATLHEDPEIELSPQEIEDAIKKDWRPIADYVPHITFKTGNDHIFSDVSHGEVEKFYEMERQIFEQLDGKPNVAGHIVKLNGEDYILLNAPVQFAEKIDKLDLPIRPLIFQASRNYIPSTYTFEDMSQNDAYTIVRLEDWRNFFKFEAPTAYNTLE